VQGFPPQPRDEKMDKETAAAGTCVASADGKQQVDCVLDAVVRNPWRGEPRLTLDVRLELPSKRPLDDTVNLS
jgi:hypothetical protein